MIVSIHSFTHAGQRHENQDRLKILKSEDGNECLLVVADGLGGHSGASLAAQTVADVARKLWNAKDGYESPAPFLQSLIRESHESVNAIGLETGLNPRSTVAALFVTGSEATSIHAGDSRVMQFSRVAPLGRTLDHSIGQINVLRGLISEDELATHPDQKKLFSHVGGEAPPEAEIKRWRLRDGTRFVVCSDGFWEVFSPSEILEVFETRNPEHSIAMRFAGKLAKLQRHDNTTAILAEFDSGLRVIWYWVALAALTAGGLLMALAE